MYKSLTSAVLLFVVSFGVRAQTHLIADSSLEITNPPSYPYGVDIDATFPGTWVREFGISSSGAGKLLSVGTYGSAGSLLYDFIGGNTTSSSAFESPWQVFLPNGNVGIGTISPITKFHVATTGNTNIAASLLWGQYYGTAIGVQSTSPSYYAFSVQGNCNSNGTGATGGVTNLLYVRADGNVGIGTANPQSTLAVAGSVTAKQVTVTQTGWSDFVFDSTYQRIPLNKLAQYVKKANHLPEIPSQPQIEKEGLDLGLMQKLQMQKIEELTLYAIDEDTQLRKQDTTIAAQQQLLLLLKQEVAAQQLQLQQQQQEIELLKSKIR